LKASYSLSYDKKRFAYVIGDSDTLSNYFTLYDKTCKTSGEGIVDLNLNLGQVKVTSVGEFTHDIRNNKKEFEGFFMLDFFFSQPALVVMSEEIYKYDYDGFDDYDDAYKDNLSRIVGNEKGELYMLDLELNNRYSDFPKEMNHALSFTKVKFKWDDVNKAYVARGELWLANIIETEINAIVDGYIVIEKGRNTDVLTIFFQTDNGGEQYFFKFENGVMLSHSYDDDFMNKIREIANDKRSVGSKNGIGAYRYQAVNDEVAEKMIRLIKKKY